MATSTAIAMNPNEQMNIAGNTATTAATTTSIDTNKSERCCENTDCNVAKLVTLVPKRKTSQFVTEPCVMEKPMLINGFTTVFQIDGTAAKLSDLKGVGNTTGTQKPVYRIKPNTHVHVINYVVVDDNGDTLRKINESDPEIMRKLLESQKKSAEMKLKKLMFSNDAVLKAATGVIPTQSKPTAIGQSQLSVGIKPTNNTQQQTLSQAVSVGGGISGVNTTARIKVISAATTKVKPNAVPQITTNSAIQLPMRTHPNLKITAVASAENINKLPQAPAATATAASSSSTITPSSATSLSSSVASSGNAMPLITPVPLSTLQNVVVEKNSFDKMQAEIQELRRTVTMLAEAQAKTQQKNDNQSASPNMQRGIKRARPN